MTQDVTGQDWAQEIAATIREAFAVTDGGDLTAQARYDPDLGGWLVRHWHRGIRYDLGMCEVGQVPGLWRDDVWVGGMGRRLPEDTPRTVAMRMLALVHGGHQVSDAAHAKAVRAAEARIGRPAEDARRLTPDEWLAMPEFEGTTILDHDGWASREEWERRITRAEFVRRLAQCTQLHPVWAERTTG